MAGVITEATGAATGTITGTTMAGNTVMDTDMDMAVTRLKLEIENEKQP